MTRAPIGCTTIWLCDWAPGLTPTMFCKTPSFAWPGLVRNLPWLRISRPTSSRRHATRPSAWPSGQAHDGRLRGAAGREALFVDAPDHDSQAIEAMEWVAASLARLSDDLREVVELKIYADLTFREISQATGLPQGTVATRYRSALEKMRGQMVKESE